MKSQTIETLISEDNYNIVKAEQGERRVEDLLMHVVGRYLNTWTINRIINVEKKGEQHYVATSEIMAIFETREQAEKALLQAHQHMNSQGFDMAIKRTLH